LIREYMIQETSFSFKGARVLCTMLNTRIPFIIAFHQSLPCDSIGPV
jgi:hypothetical protein